MAQPRLHMSTSVRRRVMDAHDGRCVYCGSAATAIDHVIPYAYLQRHEISNLVPACQDCNLIASDKMFESLEDKRAFILKRRDSLKWTTKLMLRKARCADCGLPFKPAVNGATNLLCPTCAEIADMPPGEQALARRRLEVDIAAASKEAARVGNEALSAEIEAVRVKLQPELAEAERDHIEQERIERAESQRIADGRQLKADAEAAIAVRIENEKTRKVKRNDEITYMSILINGADPFLERDDPEEFAIRTCPFCGGFNIEVWKSVDPDEEREKMWRFQCWDCYAAVLFPQAGKGIEGAAEQWNLRKSNERMARILIEIRVETANAFLRYAEAAGVSTDEVFRRAHELMRREYSEGSEE